MSDTTSPRLRPLLLCLAGTAAGFGIAVAAFWGPLGLAIVAVLVAALCWLMVRVVNQGGRLWLGVGVGVVVGVLGYFGLALVQSLTAPEPSDSGSGHSLIEGTLPYL